MSVSLATTVAVPSTGIGRCSVTACWPWTSRAGLNVPMSAITERPPAPYPMTTGNVGNTCWVTPLVFSVVKASSSAPAPMLTAYRRASLLVQLKSAGSLWAPTASGFNGMGALLCPVPTSRAFCGHDPGWPSMPELGRASASSLATTSPSCVGSSTGARRRAAAPALGDRQHLAGRLEHPAGDAGGLLGCQPRDDRGDPARRPRLAGRVVGRRRPEPLGHPGQGDGRHGVDGDAVAGDLQGGDVGERGDAGLGRAVVRLPGVAVDAADTDVVLMIRPLTGLPGLGLLAPVGDGPAATARTCP